LGPGIQTRIAAVTTSLGCTWQSVKAVDALSLGEIALAAHEKELGPDHSWTKDSARVTADALTALGRNEEAAVLRERYGLQHSAE
jgi:hypothetical protein